MFQRRFSRKTAAARLSPRNTTLISEEIYLAADFYKQYGLMVQPQRKLLILGLHLDPSFTFSTSKTLVDRHFYR